MFTKLALISSILFSVFLSAKEQSIHLNIEKVLDKNIPIILEKSNAQGIAIAVVQGQTIIGSYYYGEANLEQRKPITQETLFNAGSISKVVTAWGSMKLVAQGKIDLDMPVNNYLKRWKIPKSLFDTENVTLRNILSHTSGLSLGPYRGANPGQVLPTLVESLQGDNTGDGAVKLIHEPGTKWSYSGGGYSVVQLLIEDVSGQNFNNFMFENVLLPLGMKDSTFDNTRLSVLKLATPYDENGKETTMVYFTETAAAGFITTALDLARFNQAMLRNNNGNFIGTSVLSHQLIERMIKPEPNTNGRWSMSYVVDAENNSLGFAGFNRGWTSLTRSVLDKNIGYVILNNSSVGGVNNEIDKLLLSTIGKIKE